MSESKTPRGALVAALIKAKKAFKPVTKGHTAEVVSKRTGGKFTYSYTSLPDAIEATEPALLDNGLVITQTFEAAGAPLLLLTTTLWHESGESIAGTVEMGIGEMGVQDVGGIITYLRRYSYLAILGISPEDDDGASAQKASETRRQSTTSKPTTTKGPPEGAILPEAWVKRINAKVDEVAKAIGEEPWTLQDHVLRWCDGLHQAANPWFLTKTQATELGKWLDDYRVAGAPPPIGPEEEVPY